MAAAATRTTIASRPLLENQMKVKHAAPAALLDPTRAHTRRSLKGRPCVRADSRYPPRGPPLRNHASGLRKRSTERGVD